MSNNRVIDSLFGRQTTIPGALGLGLSVPAGRKLKLSHAQIKRNAVKRRNRLKSKGHHRQAVR